MASEPNNREDGADFLRILSVGIISHKWQKMADFCTKNVPEMFLKSFRVLCGLVPEWFLDIFFP